MKLPWPWETKRLAKHHYVTRPWQPHRDRRVLAAGWLVFSGTVVAAVWKLQAEAGLVAHKVVATLTTLLLLWMWRSLSGRIAP